MGPQAGCVPADPPSPEAARPISANQIQTTQGRAPALPIAKASRAVHRRTDLARRTAAPPVALISGAVSCAPAPFRALPSPIVAARRRRSSQRGCTAVRACPQAIRARRVWPQTRCASSHAARRIWCASPRTRPGAASAAVSAATMVSETAGWAQASSCTADQSITGSRTTVYRWSTRPSCRPKVERLLRQIS